MKKSRTKFVRYSLRFCQVLADEKASGTVRTLIDALTETWFKMGLYDQKLNPFPLNQCDTAEWGLTPMQKCRALKFLIRKRLIELDRSDPRRPLVKLTWQRPYPLETSATSNDG